MTKKYGLIFLLRVGTNLTARNLISTWSKIELILGKLF
jgi:hypothetical protein